MTVCVQEKKLHIIQCVGCLASETNAYYGFPVLGYYTLSINVVCTCMCTYFLIYTRMDSTVWLHFLPFNFVLDNPARKEIL